MAEQFIKIYDWMLDLQLEPNELLVYAFVYSLTESLGGCKGQKYICDRLRMGDRWVRSIVTRLKDRGLLKVEKGSNCFQPSTYISVRNDRSVRNDCSERNDCSSNVRNDRSAHVRNDCSSQLYIYDKNTINRIAHKNILSDRDAIFELMMSKYNIVPDDRLTDSIVGFIQNRKTLKKPLTERALMLNVNKAYKLAGGDQEQMTALFDLAVERGWQGIYEEKGKSDGTKRSDSFFKDDD